MTVRLVIGRPRPGTVGESWRVCHVFPLVEEAAIPAQLRAYCGAEIYYRDLETFTQPAGMPCEDCLRRLPRPEEPGAAPPTDR